MKYKLYKNGAVVRSIIADAKFVADYCAAMGYTYECLGESVAPARVTEPTPAPTEAEQLRADVDYIAVMTGVSL